MQINHLYQIEPIYVDWIRNSKDLTKKLECKVEDIAFDIIFVRARDYIHYTEFYGQNAQMNVSTDHKKIQEVIRNYLQPAVCLEEGFCFPTDDVKEFELRFFSDIRLLNEQLEKEDKAWNKMISPRSCTVL
jgi:hypothetical protein